MLCYYAFSIGGVFDFVGSSFYGMNWDKAY